MDNLTKENKFLLHLCADQKFIDHVIDVFEEIYPNKNIYFIELLENEPVLKFVQSNHINIITGNSGSPQFKELVNNISQFSAIILHNIVNPYKIDIILNAPSEVYFHWMVWGADLYSLPELSRDILLPESKKYLRAQESIKEKVVNYLIKNFFGLFNLFYYLKNGKDSPITQSRNCFKKIKSVSTVIPKEVDLIRKYISPKILFYPFKYSSIERFDDERKFVICNENNFLLGNSATLENNHLDLFKTLKTTEIGEIKLYCPLSYGGPSYRLYADKIISEGQEKFGNNFIPLKDFLPLQEYSNILDKCGNVVMNHIRQQALGNIIMSLWKGARVFLNEKNPIYYFLKNQGIILYTISDLKRISELPDFLFLSNYNRQILRRLYSKEQVLKETRELIAILINEKI